MLRKFDTPEKLYILIAIQSAIITGIGALGMKALKTMGQNTQTLYADQILLIAAAIVAVFFMSFLIARDARNLIRGLEESNSKIAESEAKCRAFIKYAGDSIFILDSSLQITDVNDSAVKLTGYPLWELLQLKISDIISQDELPSVTKTLDMIVKEGGSVHERKFKRKDGSIVETEVNVRMVEGVGFISIVRDISEQIKAEKELRERAAQLTTLFENLEGATSLLDAEKRYVLFNNRFILDNHLLTNSSPSIGDEVYAGFPEAIRNERLKMLDKVLEGNREVVEVDYVRDGKRVYYRTAFSPVITDGKVTGISTYSLNITKSKEAEIKIRERESLLTAVFDNMEGSLALYDVDKKIVIFNNRFALNYKLLTNQDPKMGDGAHDFLSEQERKEPSQLMDSVLKGNKEVFEKDYLNDDKLVSFRTSFTPVINEGNVTGITSFSLDITKSKEAEEKIRQSEKKYRNIFENVIDVVFQTTLDGTIMDVSPSAEGLVGLTREQLIGTRVELLYYDQTDKEKGESLPSAMRKNNGEVKDFELRFRSATGEPIYISVNARLIREANGNPMHIDGMFRNITESKKAEDEINRLNRLYQFISRINESMLKLDSKEEILAEACNIAVDVGKFQMAWFGTYDEQNDKISPTTWAGFEDGFFKSIGDSGFKVSTSSIPSARAIRAQSHFYYNDIEHDTSIPDAIKKEMLKRNYRSAISLPVFIDSKIIGAFVLLMSEPFFFTEEELRLVKDVTDNITYALDKIEIRDLRKKAETKLRHSEERHRALTENISDAIMLLDENLENIYQSPSVERITGYRMDDDSKGALDFIHPEDLQIAQQFFQIAQNSPGEAVRSQFRIHHKDGHYIGIEGTVMNLLQNENVKAFIVNYRDITERKRAETVIREQAETFSAIIENANESIWLLSPDLKVLQYNKTAKERLNLNRGKDIYIGADFKEFLYIGTENVFMPMFNDALAGKYPELESCQMGINGNEFWLRTRMYPVYDTQKRMIGVTVLTENISNRKKAEKELEQSEEKHRSLIENIGDAIYLINEKAEIIYRSPSADRVSSYTAEEMAGKKIFDFVHPDDLDMENEIFNRSNQLPGVSVPFELRSRHKEGHYIWLEGSIINLQQTPGINGFVLNYRDITERKKAQAIITELNESLEQKVLARTAQLQEANNALEAFSYSVSHDLKAPARAVIGFTNIIEDEFSSDFSPELKGLFAHISDSGKRMSTIIDDLLTLAKYEKVMPQQKVHNMEELFRAIWDKILFYTPHKATLKIDALPSAYVDGSLIEQVIVNLLSNAIKYSSKKESPIVTVNFELGDNTITYIVKDNGAGFDMKNYNKLFGAFQRLHGANEFEGTGVGLLLVKRIIEKHGGVVRAEGIVDEGAAFYFTLPLIAAS